MKLLVLASLLLLPALALAGDWPMWGRDQTRNMVSPEKNPPTDWQGEVKDENGKILKSSKNIKWQAALGSRAVGCPIVADGLVWIGTNNQSPRDPKVKGDASVLMSFRESDGKFLWQYVSPRLPNVYHDWPDTAMPPPLIQGDRLWLLSNRSETLCFDIGPLRRSEGEPRLLWKTDLVKEFRIEPRTMPMAMMSLSCVAGPYQDYVYVTTGNGKNEEGKFTTPEAPALVCLHKDTGKTVWKDNSPGRNVLDGQWSTPLVMEINGRGQVIAGQGDGWVRSFEPATGKPLWQCDLNAKDAKWDHGRGTRCQIVATAVLHDGRIFLGTGHAPYWYDGFARFACIDPTRKGDVSLELESEPGKGKPNPASAVVWSFGSLVPKDKPDELMRDFTFGRSVSTCAIQNGLVYTAEVAGYFHCLDARTGQRYWSHDIKAGVLGSPLWVDGRLYLCTEEGDVWIFPHGKEKKEPRKLEMPEGIRTTPTFANGVLYLATDYHLYAIQENQGEGKPRSRGPRVPFVPTPHDVVEKMLELAEVKKTDTVVDLGCGDGRIVITAAQKYGCKAIGFDLDRECLRLSRASVKNNQLDKQVQIIEEDIFNVDLSQVDVVTLYLWPSTNAKLIPQFEKMKPGSRIVSHAADMQGVVPEKVITVKSKDDGQERKLYLWMVPLKKEPPSK